MGSNHFWTLIIIIIVIVVDIIIITIIITMITTNTFYTLAWMGPRRSSANTRRKREEKMTMASRRNQLTRFLKFKLEYKRSQHSAKQLIIPAALVCYTAINALCRRALGTPKRLMPDINFLSNAYFTGTQSM